MSIVKRLVAVCVFILLIPTVLIAWTLICIGERQQDITIAEECLIEEYIETVQGYNEY